MEIYGTASILSGKNNLREMVLLAIWTREKYSRWKCSDTSLFVYTQDLTPKQKFGAQPKAVAFILCAERK